MTSIQLQPETLEREFKNFNFDKHEQFQDNYWHPLNVTTSPINLVGCSVFPYLHQLGIINEDGTLNHLIENAGLFCVNEVVLPELGQMIPKRNILVSTEGLRFLQIIEEQFLIQQING